MAKACEDPCVVPIDQTVHLAMHQLCNKQARYITSFVKKQSLLPAVFGLFYDPFEWGTSYVVSLNFKLITQGLFQYVNVVDSNGFRKTTRKGYKYSCTCVIAVRFVL